MLNSPGFRVSLIGMVVFLVSALSMLVLPHGFSIVGMLAGGMGVWGGFVMTILHYYVSPGGDPPDA